MATRTRRKNQNILIWARAAAVASVTYAGLLAMGFAPNWGAASLALIGALLTLVATDLGVLVAVLALSIPLIAANVVLGLTVLVLGVIAIRYLGADGGEVFFLLVAAVVGAFFGPVWAAVVIAGYLLGPGEGALAAAMACAGVEVLGIALGRPALGVTLTGGNAASRLLDFTSQPKNFMAVGWLKDAFGGLDSGAVNSFMTGFTAADRPGLLIAQPVLWAFGAGIAGALARNGRKSRRRWVGYAGLAAGIATVAVGNAVIAASIGASPDVGRVAVALISSLIVAAAFVWIWDEVFTLEVLKAPKRLNSMAAEDADVDELLRLVATAEEKLTTEHTTVKTVMITDMKSFSKMTEEDGSVLTAKAIQRHRDLLLPLIEKYGGHGKSTGGDGLVAAFENEESAVSAATEMQRALASYNASHPDSREMTVRIGVARGDIVLDKSGRPFIGNALNLAARVMNLADGGQAFVTAAVYAKAASVVQGHSHGEFELKNIAKPVEVVELIYAEGQKPIDPRGRVSAA